MTSKLKLLEKEGRNLRMLLGFDFYGAGNIGDDLMLEGFLGEYYRHCNIPLSCNLSTDRIFSQKNRFDKIEWLSLDNEEKKILFAACDYWVGVGGTPFQSSIGPWLLKKLNHDFCLLNNSRKLMVGIGCEEEVVQEKQAAIKIAQKTEHIWTRDKKSTEILVDLLGISRDKVTTGGDFSHIALRTIFPENTSIFRDRIAIVYNTENLKRDTINLMAIKAFLLQIEKDIQAVFVANDVRKGQGFEHSIYKHLFGGLINVFNKKPNFFSPDYEASNIKDLVAHFLNYDTVMASRYHAILTAAWAGCRVVALDRSSKIRNLAEELNIPLVKAPFTLESLYEGYCNAKAVSRTLLEEKAVAAENSVVALCRMVE